MHVGKDGTFILPLPRIHPEFYLDTNAWSELAKGNRLPDRLDAWLAANQGFLVFSAYSAIELSRAPHLFDALTNFISDRATVMLIHGEQEFTGKPIYWASYYNLFLPLNLRSAEARNAFIDELRAGPILAAAAQLAGDKHWLETWIEDSILNCPISSGRPWDKFDDMLKRWLTSVVATAGHSLHPDGLRDRTRYRGLKLQFAYLFERFYVSRKKWQDSDYLDYLHLRDMAYAHTVLTERALASSIREVAKHRPDIGPNTIFDLSWLNADD